MNKWVKAQEWEKDWHLTQQFNSYNEETKQYMYASKMGLDEFKVNYYGQIGWDFGDKKVLVTSPKHQVSTACVWRDIIK